MKRTNVLLLSLTIAILSSCTPQTEDTSPGPGGWKRAGRTDLEIVQGTYGHSQNYSVVYREVLPGYENEISLTKLEGAVIPVVFNDHKITIEGFGILLGSYNAEYYANTYGTITVKFTEKRNSTMADAHAYNGPLGKSEYLMLRIYDNRKTLVATFDLKRLDTI